MGHELKKVLYKEAQKLSGLSCLTTAEPEVCGGKNNFNHLTPGADTEGGGHWSNGIIVHPYKLASS